jgi:hypothetical protein
LTVTQFSLPSRSYPEGITLGPDGNIWFVETGDNGNPGAVAVSIGNNPGSSTLAGTTSLGANNGIITFSGLSLNNRGNDYTLLVTDPTSVLQAAATAGFNVTPEPATQLIVTAQPPSSVVAGASFGLTISAENGLNQVDTGDHSSLTLSLMGGNGATLGGPFAANFIAGVAVFSGLSIDLIGANYAIKATSGLLNPATTSSFSVISASASTFSLVPVTSGNQIIGVPFPVKVTALDPFGNIVSSCSGSVHLSSTTDLAFSGPADYTYLPSDAGSHVFQVTLGTLGNQNLSVADDSNSTIAATTTISVVQATPTSTTLTVTPTSSVYGQSITLKANVTKNAGTGTVTFLDGSTVLGSAPLTSTGATLVYAPNIPLATGTHSFVAMYSGSTDGTLAPSQSSASSFKVNPDTTTARASASASALILGQSIVLTATINPVSPATAFPSGTVKFLDGTTTLGTVTLDGSGHATLTLPKLALGTHSITVSYSGSINDLLSVSSAIKVYVGDLPDFDGDGKADAAVFGLNPTTGKYGFTIVTSSSGFKSTVIFNNFGYGFGNAQSIPVVGDYFGDGKDSYALWTPNSLGGMTFTAVSSVNYKSVTVNFGGANEIPVVADVDGDGKADFGVYGYLPGHGYCFDFLLSSDNFNVNQQDVFNNNGYGYGNATSIPVVADFDGNGKADFGLYNPTTTGATFTYIDPSTYQSITQAIPSSLVTSNAVPIAVQYDGDNKADLALYGSKPGNSSEYGYVVLTASSGFNPSQAVTFNNNGYGYGNSYSIPVMADYDGTGKDDFAVYTPDFNGGMEYVFQTSQTGAGVTVDFPSSLTELPLATSPAFLAKKVRGS